MGRGVCQWQVSRLPVENSDPKPSYKRENEEAVPDGICLRYGGGAALLGQGLSELPKGPLHRLRLV